MHLSALIGHNLFRRQQIAVPPVWHHTPIPLHAYQTRNMDHHPVHEMQLDARKWTVWREHTISACFPLKLPVFCCSASVDFRFRSALLFPLAILAAILFYRVDNGIMSWFREWIRREWGESLLFQSWCSGRSIELVNLHHSFHSEFQEGKKIKRLEKRDLEIFPMLSKCPGVKNQFLKVSFFSESICFKANHVLILLWTIAPPIESFQTIP